MANCVTSLGGRWRATAGHTEVWLLVAVAAGTLLAPLNSTMIAVALPRVTAEFGGDLSSTGWLITGYLLAMATLQPATGKLGDRFGRRSLILGALTLFGLASLGAALAPNVLTLTIGRVAQGVAGAIVVPNGSALLREAIPNERRGARLGWFGSAIALAAAVGPLLGGVLVDFAGWRAIFWINAPIVALALALTWRFAGSRANPAAPPATPAASPSFDGVGLVLLLATLVGGAVWLTVGHRVFEAPTYWLIGGLLAPLAFAFVAHERRHVDPIIRPMFFRQRAFVAGAIAIAGSNLAMYTTLIALPLLFAARGDRSSADVGVLLAMMSVGMVVVAPLGGRLADRRGRRWPTVVGLGLQTAGCVPLALIGPAIGPEWLTVGLAMSGVGLGLANAGINAGPIEAIPARDAGAASGVLSTSRYLGSILGASLLAAATTISASTDAGLAVIFWLIFAAAALSTLAATRL